MSVTAGLQALTLRLLVLGPLCPSPPPRSNLRKRTIACESKPYSVYMETIASLHEKL